MRRGWVVQRRSMPAARTTVAARPERRCLVAAAPVVAEVSLSVGEGIVDRLLALLGRKLARAELGWVVPLNCRTIEPPHYVVDFRNTEPCASFWAGYG